MNPEDDELPPPPKPLSECHSAVRPTFQVLGPESMPWLSSCASFALLPVELIELVESRMRESTFGAGEIIMRQSETGSYLMVIRDGTVEVSTRDEAGVRHFIDRSGPSEVLGEMALLTQGPRTADAIAVTPVRALLLDAAEFHELAREHPPLSVVLSHLVATRLGGTRRDVLAGKELHGYNILRRLGRGGMGVVYEAVEVTTGRHVALKMMSHRLVYDAAALAQFEREARLIDSFRHENIVQMHGRFAAFHTYFIVMRFCSGEPLSDLIARHGRLVEAECRKILGQLARGLAYAHAAGVIHRDVKPANVLVSSDGLVQLSDFGLARPVVDPDSILQNLIVGSPQYMAPEQMLGLNVDTRADYFSLGCVAYELLTGRSLFAQASLGELARRRATWEIPEVRGLCEGMSEPMCQLLEGCLQREPEDRCLDLEILASWAAPVDRALVSIQ